MNTISKANQIKIVISFAILAALIACALIFKDNILNINNAVTDNEKFHLEYSKVEQDNLFKYVTAKEAIDLFNSEEAVIFFGFKECKWCQSFAPVLNELGKANNANVIYYCNIRIDRANGTEEYNNLVSLLKEYLELDSNGNSRIYVPDVYFVKDKKIVGHNNYTSTISGEDVEEYYSGDNLEKLKENLADLFKKVYNNTCSDDTKGC